VDHRFYHVRFLACFPNTIAFTICLMKSESVRINGIDIFYEMEGSGEPLLLLHGGTGCHENWIHAGGETLAHEYTLIKPDARGHGRTNNP
jgi:pimeloyl-ACP methyl ester carboxylesterase